MSKSPFTPFSDLNPHSKPNQDRHKTSVLIVEDNLIAGLGLQVALERLNCSIDIANTGIEAINLIKKKIIN